MTEGKIADDEGQRQRQAHKDEQHQGAPQPSRHRLSGQQTLRPPQGAEGEGQRHRPVPADAHQQALDAEGHRREQRQVGEVLDEVIHRVEHLPDGQRQTDAHRLQRDLGALQERDPGIEPARDGKGRQRAQTAGIELAQGGRVEHRRPRNGHQHRDQGHEHDAAMTPPPMLHAHGQRAPGCGGQVFGGHRHALLRAGMSLEF